MKDKDTDSIINGYKKYMKDNEISDKDIETATSYVKPFVQFLFGVRKTGTYYWLSERWKRALDFSSTLVYNLLRKWIGCNIRFALSVKMFIRIVS